MTQASAALFAALKHGQRRVRDDSTGNSYYRLDFDAAVHQFKLLWIYTSRKSIDRAATSASGSHLFLFHKNLHVTNISHAELLALLRVHTTRRENNQKHEVNFYSDFQYSRFLRNLIESLFPAAPIQTPEAFKEIVKNIANLVVEEHHAFVIDTMIVNSYFTTSLIHIPLSLRVDIQKVVFESGYIQSAGHALYVRRVDKANQSELEERLRRFMASKHVTPKIYLTPYADEYFTPHEKETSIASVRNGLDGVRIDLRKHHISAQPLRDFLNALEVSIEGIHVARGLEHYGTEREKSLTNPDWTIWLIADAGNVATYDGAITRSQDQYLMVYAQYYENSNQFILFKERKPAWTAPITVPHTLSISMVNLIRPTLSRYATKRPIILDPFCGTGTTLIDAAIRLPNAAIIGLDRNPLTPRMVKDNLQFFSFEPNFIHDLNIKMGDLCRSLNLRINGLPNSHIDTAENLVSSADTFDLDKLAEGDQTVEEEFQNAVRACLHEFKTATENPANYLDTGGQLLIDKGFSDALTTILSGDGMEWRGRIMFFLTWRALATARHIMRGDVKNLYFVILREFSQFAKELEHYYACVNSQQISQVGSFVERVGKYSRSGVVGIKSIRDIEHYALSEADLDGDLSNLQTRRIHTLVNPDSTETLRTLEGKVDAIITDPPFGFNTSEFDSTNLQRLYSKFVTRAVRALRPGGQLLVSVPSFARNGKQVPYFQTQGAVIRQIIAAANEAKRDVINIVHTIPAQKAVYQPPFYWLSPTALSRRIIWFTMGQ